MVLCGPMWPYVVLCGDWYDPCLAVLVPIVNAINILTHGFGCNIRFIFLVFVFSELFGTRAYALVQITQKIKKLEI